MLLSKPSETLCLQHSAGQNIFIDLPCDLPQHQIDGIRFLFRHYKKKTPGVILNDPSGYGKRLQVVLFLKALRPILKKPVLILSNDLDNWKENFEIWTDLSDELAIESTSPFTKKLVMINPVKDGLAFARRSWSIVLLHDEDCTRELLTMTCNADYKIWVTSMEFKENLPSLASIYKWLYPNQEFNVANFTAKKGDRRDRMEKAILLDAFLEDFLLRRTDFLTPFFKPNRNRKPTPSPVKQTRKNKDPTGTKVKRSKKRRIEDDEDNSYTDINVTTLSNDSFNTSKDYCVREEDSTTVDRDNKMDVESFIRSENPVESFDYDSSSHTKDSVNGEQTDESSVTKLVNDLVEKDENNEKEVTIDSPNIFTEIDVHKLVQAESKDVRNILVPGTEDSNDFINKTELETKGVIIPETENSESNESQSGMMLHYNESERFEDKSNNVAESTERSHNDKERTEPEAKESNGIDDKKSNNLNKSETRKDTNSKSDNTNNVKDKVTKDMDDLDAKLAEYQAKLMAKFKGSALDSIC